MRLAILCLTCALALSAQTPGPATLPWRAAVALPWQMDAPDGPPEPMPASAQTDLPLTVRMAMDGHISVVSEKGRGSTFTVDLPLLAEDVPSGDAPCGDAPCGDAPCGDAPCGDAP